MSHGAAQPAGRRPRIVDVVFAASRGTSWGARGLLLALVAALGVHGSLIMWAKDAGQSLESWSADLALRVHEALSEEELDVAQPPPPPPTPPPEPEAPTPPPKAAPRVPVARREAPAEKPQPPARAGRILAQAPDPNEPVDLTGETFVSGMADAYAGGVTTASGTSRTAVRAVAAAPAPAAKPRARSAGPDRSGPVSLPEQDWSCPWPREAEGEPIDEQVVVMRVWVRPDGSVESAKLVHDLGHGFGQAALACALRTRFTPAKDRAGRAIRAQSPPIVVRFTR